MRGRSRKHWLEALIRRHEFLSKRVQNDPHHRLSFDWEERGSLRWAIREIVKIYPELAPVAGSIVDLLPGEVDELQNESEGVTQ